LGSDLLTNCVITRFGSNFLEISHHFVNYGGVLRLHNCKQIKQYDNALPSNISLTSSKVKLSISDRTTSA